MNILFVSAVFPYPLHSGGQIRVYNLLKRLSAHHHIHLFSFIRDEEEARHMENLSFCKDMFVVFRGHAWRPSYMLKALVGKYPFVMSTYDIRAMKERITQEIRHKQIDCIHIEPGYVWPVIPETTIPIVVCEHNIEHTVYQEYIHRYQYPYMNTLMKRDVEKLKQWERIIWKKVSTVITVSEEDAQVVRKVTHKNVHVVPNGIDEQVFSFNPPNTIANNFSALFVGNFSWIQNTDAVQYLLEQVWPQVHSTFPNATLRIVGRKFPKKFFPVPSSVTIVQHVEDITDEFNKCDIVLAPIRIGGGTKYKILEAMASGKPVITTKKGAQGLPLVHKRNCYIADESEEWIQNITEMIDQPSDYKKVVKNARILVEKEYSWDKIADTLSTVWKTLLYQSS